MINSFLLLLMLNNVSFNTTSDFCDVSEARFLPPNQILICYNTSYNKNLLLQHEVGHYVWYHKSLGEKIWWGLTHHKDRCFYSEEYCDYYNQPSERFARQYATTLNTEIIIYSNI